MTAKPFDASEVQVNIFNAFVESCNLGRLRQIQPPRLPDNNLFRIPLLPDWVQIQA